MYVLINYSKYIVLSQVVFQPVPTNTSWWYVIQVAPRSKQIYEEHELIEDQADEGITLQYRASDPTDRPLDVTPEVDNGPASDISNGVEEDEHELDEDDDEVNALEMTQLENNIDDIALEYHTDTDLGELDLFIDIFAHQDLVEDENYCNFDDA